MVEEVKLEEQVNLSMNLAPPDGARHSKKRVGRGKGSGQGTYAGKGLKGQNARSGGGVRPGFEGGQTPLVRRLPRKRGFRNFSRVEFEAVNIGMLQSRFEAGAVVDSDSLFEKNLIRGIDSSYKILGSGSLDKSLNVDAPRISQGAKEAIEAAGGSYNETSPAEKRVRNRKHLRKT